MAIVQIVIAFGLRVSSVRVHRVNRNVSHLDRGLVELSPYYNLRHFCTRRDVVRLMTVQQEKTS